MARGEGVPPARPAHLMAGLASPRVRQRGLGVPSALQQKPHPCLVPFGGQVEAAHPLGSPAWEVPARLPTCKCVGIKH